MPAPAVAQHATGKAIAETIHNVPSSMQATGVPASLAPHHVAQGREPAFQVGEHQDYVRIPDEFIFTPTNPAKNAAQGTTEREFIKAIYPVIEEGELQPAFLMERAILTTLNDDVKRLNDIATAMLPSNEQRTYLGQDSIPDDADNRVTGHYPTEFLNSLDPPGIAPFQLNLKVGQPAILIRNVDPKRGLCNGTRLIVRKLGRKFIECEILLGDFMGKRVILPRIPLDTTEDGSAPPKFRRRQFPIKPAFAMTINKTQGQTLNVVGLYLLQPVFGHGQLYVGLSRCTDPRI